MWNRQQVLIAAVALAVGVVLEMWFSPARYSVETVRMGKTGARVFRVDALTGTAWSLDYNKGWWRIREAGSE